VSVPNHPLYISADTAPQGLAVRRPVWLAPLFLACFGLACAAAVPWLPGLTRHYADVLAAGSGAPLNDVAGPAASLSFRPLMALLLVLLAAFSAGSPRARLRLATWSVSIYALAVVALDTALAAAPGSFLPPPLAPGPGVVSALLGVMVVVVSIFTHRRLPRGVRVATRRRSAGTTVPVLLVSLGGAAVVALTWWWVRTTALGGIRVPFNGWISHDLVVGLVALICLLRVLSALEERQLPGRGPDLSVAFLVPAYNEAHGIGACIRSLDAAAARRPDGCAAYIVDNASSDATAAVARAALAACAHLHGAVLHCPTPGKAKALNFGLARITEDLVVRIDADTEVEPSLLATVVPRFWDRSVGGVGGFPLPKESGPRWIGALRLVEVYTAIAFFRVAQSALDGTTVMPGSIAVYRRSLLVELGGFGLGFNGEDSDITMRIGRLGYRIVTDARVRVRTECPATLAELREQRQRWTRGRFHMAARNLSAIRMAQGIRATWMLPQSLVNACRRCLMIPLLVGSAAVEVTDPSVLSLREIFAVARVVVGIQFVGAAVLLLVHRQYRALPYAPLTLVYRLVLAYIAFETVLTLALRDAPPAPARHRPEVPRHLIPGGVA
jgi:cellulose synthase/poly-beta-1,6-N-acetylglucosamine synthase-like glycosyltransferase